MKNQTLDSPQNVGWQKLDINITGEQAHRIKHRSYKKKKKKKKKKEQLKRPDDR